MEWYTSKPVLSARLNPPDLVWFGQKGQPDFTVDGSEATIGCWVIL